MSQGDTGDTVRELEADIARTREAISGDVDELAQQLNPDRYKAQVQARAQETLQSAQDAVMASVQEVADSFVETSKGARSGVIATIRRHPISATLVGLGIALLAVGGGVGRVDESADKGTDDAGNAFGDYEGNDADARYAQPDVGARTDHTSYGGRGASDPYAQDQRQGQAVRRRSGLEPDTYDTYGGTYGRGYGDRYRAYESGYDAGADVGGDGEGRTGDASALGGIYGTVETSVAGRASRADTQTGLPYVKPQAKRRARRRGRGLATFIEAYPVVAGVVTVLAGAAVGLALPGTRQEDELLGDAKGDLAGQAKNAARDTFAETKETARHAFSERDKDTEAT